MKSMLGASTKAFDTMTSMAKQLTDIAEANMQAAAKRSARLLAQLPLPPRSPPSNFGASAANKSPRNSRAFLRRP
jgi:hypothetical protein